MRLIDADKLKANIPSKMSIIFGKKYEETKYKYETIKVINTEPTVKAIPIEWIKNWFNPKYANTVYYSLLRDMIRDWEEENEVSQR